MVKRFDGSTQITFEDFLSILPSFVTAIAPFCRSDEDMFQRIEDTFSNHMTAQVFACTVGQKPSKAKYYLDDTIEVMQLLNGLANSAQQH